MNHLKTARFLGAAAGTAIAAGLTVLAAAQAGAGSSAAIRWVDRPVAIPALSSAGAAANPGLASCASSDLAVRLERRGLISAGTFAYIYSAKNRGTHACYVSGSPSVKLTGRAVRRGPNVLNVVAGVVQPGASARFAVTQSPRASCSAGAGAGAAPSAGPNRVTVRPTVKVGARAAAAAGAITVSSCTGTSVTPIGVPQTAPKPDTLSALTVSLQAPPFVRAGRMLHFTVTLTNPSAVPIRLAPCPGYEIAVSSASPAAYRLNCSAPVIAAHQSRTFEMRYAVPAGTPAGIAKFGWFLLTANRTGAGGFITVTG